MQLQITEDYEIPNLWKMIYVWEIFINMDWLLYIANIYEITKMYLIIYTNII